MRKILLYFLLFTAGLSSCSKEDDPVFDRSPDDRINETLQRYSEALAGAEHGWKGLVFPNGVKNGVFGFYFRFDNNNRVQMYSDFDSLSFGVMKESSYRLKALQQPCLLFDTYSYLHVLCDPDAGWNGGSYGVGLESDFEFSIEKAQGDTIELKGRLHSSKALLIKATKQEADDYTGGKRNWAFRNISKYTTYFKRLKLGDQPYDVGVNQHAHTITFSWVDGEGTLRKITTGYYYTPDGIAFSPAFRNGEQTVDGFTDISWDEASRTLRFKAGSETVSLTEVTRPLGVDTAAPRRWWQYAVDQNMVWATYYGFYVNGERDAYRITSLPGYSATYFWPRYNVFDGVSYDLLGFAVPRISYGPAFRPPVFTADGRVLFTYLGMLGELPPDDSPVLNSAARLIDQSGYYLVQTGETTYDMVSAKDGKAWINWVISE
jgi:hypothetical protein